MSNISIGTLIVTVIDTIFILVKTTLWMTVYGHKSKPKDSACNPKYTGIEEKPKQKQPA